MANQVTATGVETDSLADTISNLTGGFTTIYGPGVNFGPESPDGQIIGDFAQVVQDELDFTVQVNSGFDPDQAVGVILDQRVALNGLKRQGGTFSTTDVTIVTSAAVSLVGLDGANVLTPPANLFIVSDAAGNQWALVNSYAIGSATSTILTFQALAVGAILTTANTLTIPVTVMAGVTSVNNPSSQLTTGQPSEQDSALKIRRRQSTAINSSGFYDSMVANLLNIPGITTAQVYENDTGSTGIPENADVPGHSIWVVVGGTASDAAIAQAIYATRSAGCGMYGAVSYVVTRLNGPAFTVSWDVVTAEDLYVEFVCNAISGNLSPTGTVSSGSPDVTLTGSYTTANLAVGYLVRGTAIPAGTTILSITNATQFVLSANATGNHMGETLTIVPIVVSALTAAMAAQFSADVFADVNYGQIISLIQSINPNVLPTTVQVSTDDSTWLNIVTPTTAQYQFTLAAEDINVT